MRNIFRYQFWHALALAVLVGLIYLLTIQAPTLLTGSLWGRSSSFWFWLALAIPTIHQTYVWFVWRLELYYHTFTKLLGVHVAFTLYSIGFSVLFVGRLVGLIILALSTRGSLEAPSYSTYIISALILPLSSYLFYSVARFFTVKRAYGIDHFDPSYSAPFVERGIYRHTDNGMYLIGMMVLYIPGLLLFSQVALLVALFNHLYIWVHFYTVERPDMAVIYGTLPE